MALLLKIFILQRKNRHSFDTVLKITELSLLSLLWKLGYILGLACQCFNIYTIFLKKQFKQFLINFFKLKLTIKYLYKLSWAPLIKTTLVFSSKGFIANPAFKKYIGGRLLCDIF